MLRGNAYLNERNVCRFVDADRYPDPALRWQLTMRAMSIYIRTYQSATWSPWYGEWIKGLPIPSTDIEFTVNLTAVREMALDESEFRDGDNCQPGTLAFFNAFGIDEPRDDEINDPEPEETLKRVTVTMTMTFDVRNTSDADDTYSDVRRYLNPSFQDLGNIDDIDWDSVSVDVDTRSMNVEDLGPDY